jgi:hypothetical protein
MTTAGPPDQQQLGTEERPPAMTAVERANRLSAGNMLRSLAPLVAICLVLVGWLAFLRDEPDTPVAVMDPGPSIGRAAEYAAYQLQAPVDLPEGYRATDTDVRGTPGEPVTLGVDYVTPSDEYVGFVTSDDPEAAEVVDVLEGVEVRDVLPIGGRDWSRGTTQRDETLLWWADAGVTVLVTGSASEEELVTVATAVRPVD